MQLPPGKYVLRAILSADGKSIKTLTRGFEIAPPKVLLTSADGLGGERRSTPSCSCRWTTRAMTPAFERDAAVDEATLAPFRERVAAERQGRIRSGHRAPRGRRLREGRS